MVAMDDVIILQKEFRENPSLAAKNELIIAEKYLEILYEQEDQQEQEEQCLKWESELE
jgi:hypothetical protein